MALSRCHASANQFAAAIQPHEGERFTRTGAQAVAIETPERRAGDDDALPLGAGRADGRTDQVEPGHAVFVPQRQTGAHAGNVCGRVQRIPLDHRVIQFHGNTGCNGGLSTAADPHDDHDTRHHPFFSSRFTRPITQGIRNDRKISRMTWCDPT